VGRADLPAPDNVTIHEWPHLASGAMPLEANVSQYVVEPLIRFALDGSNHTWLGEYPVGRSERTTSLSTVPFLAVQSK